MTQRADRLPAAWPGVRFSFKHHIVPPLLGLAVGALMYSLLNFQLIEARGRYYISQLLTDPVTNATPALSAAVPKDRASELIIPSIAVKAPIIYEPSIDNDTIAYRLRNGIVHYGTSAKPGEKGNVVIFGHSSGLTWAPGDYKFVFTSLDKLKAGQQITLKYNGHRYIYVVNGSEVVAPTNMKVLTARNAESELLLITCTPVGTNKNRLIVRAKQLYPDPAKNKPFKPAAVTLPSEIPGNQ